MITIQCRDACVVSASRRCRTNVAPLVDRNVALRKAMTFGVSLNTACPRTSGFADADRRLGNRVRVGAEAVRCWRKRDLRVNCTTSAGTVDHRGGPGTPPVAVESGADADRAARDWMRIRPRIGRKPPNQRRAGERTCGVPRCYRAALATCGT